MKFVLYVLFLGLLHIHGRVYNAFSCTACKNSTPANVAFQELVVAGMTAEQRPV